MCQAPRWFDGILSAPGNSVTVEPGAEMERSEHFTLAVLWRTLQKEPMLEVCPKGFASSAYYVSPPRRHGFLPAQHETSEASVLTFQNPRELNTCTVQ